MPTALLVSLLRGLILVGMLAAFGISLGSALAKDLPARGPQGDSGRDPGLRVLLTARRETPDGAVTEPVHERLQIDVQVPCWLVTPDQPDNEEHELKIDPGEQLLVKPDADGLVFSSQTWGKEKRWPVTRLRLQPRDTTLADEGRGVPFGRLDPTRFEERRGQPVFALNGRRYRGSLEVVYRNPKQLSALNLLPIEVYVAGVVAVEMKASFPLEALKAQAIASRSYAVAHGRRAAAARRAFDVTDSLDDQEYRGAGHGGELVAQAVRETVGQILVTPRLRQPFAPFFHASDGGWTESVDAVAPKAADVTGREPIAALMPSLPDPFCKRAAEALGYLGSHWEQQAVLRPQAIRTRLQEWLRGRGDTTTTVGYVTDLQIVDRDETSQRVRRIAILHTPHLRTELTGHEFRMMMGPHLVRSTLWLSLTTLPQPGERVIKDFIITYRGWGHGVGMSQISAWAMAKDGYRHQQILQVFYPGAEIMPW